MQDKECVEVDEREKELIELYRMIPDDKKEKFLLMMQSIKKLLCE